MKIKEFLKYIAIVAIATLTFACGEDSTSEPAVIAPPKITSLTPSSGAPGITVAANGVNLQSLDSVKLGKIKIATFVSDEKSLSFVVPPTAITSKVYVYKGKNVDSSQTFTVIGGKDDLDVDDVQNIMISEFTATWCGPCGQWGKPTINKVAEKYGKRSVKISFNSSPSNDVLYVSDASTYSDYVQIDGYPTQAVNLVAVNQVFPASIADIEQRVFDLSDAAAAKFPDAVVGLTFKENGSGSNSYTVRTRTRFINDMPDGKYNVAVFVIQDNIIEAQNGNSASYEHKGVFRKTALNQNGIKQVWGTEIATSNAKAGEKFEKTFTIDAPDVTGKLAWVKANMKAVAVVYKMNANGTRPEAVINCNIATVK